MSQHPTIITQLSSASTASASSEVGPTRSAASPPSAQRYFASPFEHCPISMEQHVNFEPTSSSPPPPTYSPPPLPGRGHHHHHHHHQSPFISSSCISPTPSEGCPHEHKPVNYCKLLFKIGIVLISFAGFLYQATDICAHYFSYRTVVYTNTEQDSLVDLPSITFCLPTYFTKKSLEDLYEPYIKRNVEETAGFKNRSMVEAIKPVIYETFQVGHKPKTQFSNPFFTHYFTVAETSIPRPNCCRNSGALHLRRRHHRVPPLLPAAALAQPDSPANVRNRPVRSAL